MKKIKLVIMMLLLLLVPAFAEVKDGYYIENFDIDFVVNEDNTFDIIETIDAVFTENKHGIIREIPVQNTIVRLDGSKGKNKAKISNLTVNEHFTSTTGTKYCQVKIGSPDYTVYGPKQYVIKYSYDIGNDPLKDKDEIYFNLIGNEWSTEIRHVTFTVHLPKTDEPIDFGFSAGKYGNADYSDVTFEWLDDQTIIGSVDRTLEAGEGLTFRAEFEEGYFKSKINYSFYVSLIAIVLLTIGLRIYIKKTQPNIVKVINYYPPEDLNSFYTRIAYDGEKDKNAACSLLILLADKGCISIADGENGDYTIKKLKEYDGSDEALKDFMYNLFEYKDEVHRRDIETNYSIIMDTMKNGTKFKDKISNKIPWKKFLVPLTLILTPVLMSVAIGCFDPSLLEFLIIWIGFLWIMLNFNSKTSAVIFLSLFLFASILAINLMALGTVETAKLVIINIAVIVSYISALTLKIENLNDKGVKLRGEVVGFKEFLETVEKDKLEELVEDDPTYFYNILPYTMALDISEKWVKKFETIGISCPSWYHSDTYSYVTLSRTLNSFSNTTKIAYNREISRRSTSSRSSSSSGHSSSGGGFSGGGSGGGGGHSW